MTVRDYSLDSESEKVFEISDPFGVAEPLSSAADISPPVAPEWNMLIYCDLYDAPLL